MVGKNVCLLGKKKEIPSTPESSRSVKKVVFLEITIYNLSVIYLNAGSMD